MRRLYVVEVMLKVEVICVTDDTGRVKYGGEEKCGGRCCGGGVNEEAEDGRRKGRGKKDWET